MTDPSKPWLIALVAKIEEDREAVEFDIGPFTWREHAPYEEVEVILEGKPSLRAYLVEDRLVVDDYWPLLSERP